MGSEPGADVPTPHELRLPGGRVVTVRPGGPADVDGLLALYRGLDADDRHRRFFTASPPPRRTVEAWSRVAERGGVLLVAETDDASGQLVAEAGCDLLANGDGEFALTVARHWRGWLGPFLFDALLDAAAAAGIPNVEGDVLVQNGPMLAIARARGSAIAEGLDLATTRVVVSTTGGPPSWPRSDGRRRVLVEAGGLGWPGQRELRQAGYEVLTCRGPRPGHETDCPLLVNRPCPLVEGADAVVFAMATDREPGASLLAVHRARPGGPPCVEMAGFASVADAVASAGRGVQPDRHPAPAPDEVTLSPGRRTGRPGG